MYINLHSSGMRKKRETDAFAMWICVHLHSTSVHERGKYTEEEKEKPRLRPFKNVLCCGIYPLPQTSLIVRSAKSLCFEERNTIVKTYTWNKTLNVAEEPRLLLRNNKDLGATKAGLVIQSGREKGQPQ